jgi:hypothetical protein
MATLLLTQHFEVTIDGIKHSGGSRSAPQSITTAETKVDVTKSVAVAETWDAWGVAGEDGVSSFTFLFVETDLDGVQLELTCDKSGTNGVVVAAFILKADKPFMLATNGAMANYTADFATGTVDVIDRIRVRNPSGASGAAKVRVFLAG